MMNIFYMRITYGLQFRVILMITCSIHANATTVIIQLKQIASLKRNDYINIKLCPSTRIRYAQFTSTNQYFNSMFILFLDRVYNHMYMVRLFKLIFI